MVYLYHYTDAASAQLIRKSGFILKSRSGSGDAAFGEGVYLTEVDPDNNGKLQVLINNYDGTTIDQFVKILVGLGDKTEVAFRFDSSKLPGVSKVSSSSSSRNVWLYPNDITLAGKQAVLVKDAAYFNSSHQNAFPCEITFHEKHAEYGNLNKYFGILSCFHFDSLRYLDRCPELIRKKSIYGELIGREANLCEVLKGLKPGKTLSIRRK